MTKSQIIAPQNKPEPSIEIRINSVDDATSAVQNSKLIHDEAFARGINSIEFLVAAGLEKRVDKILIGIFRLKLYFKTVKPQPENIFFPIPHAKNFNIPMKHIQQPSASPIGLLPLGMLPVSERRKPGRPPKPQAAP